MTTITVRIPDHLLKELEKQAGELKVPRSAYIRKALEHMNKEVAFKKRSDRLQEVSRRVRLESMKVNTEFSEIEYDPAV
jgi:metal-responsive CopG/Arc/MetJ family transcriptional regulator